MTQTPSALPSSDILPTSEFQSSNPATSGETGFTNENASVPCEKLPLVLVIEAEPGAESNQLLLDSLAGSYRVVSSGFGREGRDQALALRPDLILADANSERISELRKCRELDDVPIILMTTGADDDLRDRLLEEGAQDFLAKPFSAIELLVRVRNLVSMKRARDLLQKELLTRSSSIEALANEVAVRKRETETAFEEARVARDIAEQANRFKSNLIGLMSHELRSPLAALRLHLTRLSREQVPPPSPAQMDVVRKMSTSLDRLVDLVTSLLEYVQFEGGRLSANIETFDIGKLGAGVVEEMRAHADAKSLTLCLSSAIDMPEARTDPRLVRLILINLIANAIKFTKSGRIDVTMSHGESGHVILVRDTGPGIPDILHARIFEPFEQLEPITSKHAHGVGLGLALVREMVKALDGNITLESVEGEGCVFTVCLPAMVAASETAWKSEREVSAT